ncbi:hypothetical protein GHT06_013814 [Daphnia sinensis]|uniref:Uncharacterized protein n=1 Tax=Daphnia sinensis TaxID=1820382 RepID=A0AAD5KVE0_9CRUS|nr:hypothetical protein GHT06_013814 [Daphnia sinensis]
MAEPIRISALGRDAQVGDFYNYFTDVISKSSIDVPNERKKISEAEGDGTLLFFYQQPEKFKHQILGINSHLLQSIKSGSVPGHQLLGQLWFSDYLNTNSMDGDEEHAQVTLLFRVVRRTETLDSDFIRSKIDEYRLRSADGGATHVIDEIVYGAEFICSMRKTLTLPQETKESAAVGIYLAAKKYLDEAIAKSTSLELPVELMDQVSCTVLSSIEPGRKNEMSFVSFSRYLQDLLSSNTGNSQQKWKPIEFLLRSIPAARIEARMWSDRKADFVMEKERHEITRIWMIKEIRGIANDPSLKRFPLLEKLVCHFQDLMPHFWKNVEVACKKYETFSPEKAFQGMVLISSWLNKIIDWIAYRRKEVQEIGWLLSGTDFELLNSAEIEARMGNKECKIAKLFVLKVEDIQDPLIHELETLVGQQTSNAVRPVLPIFSYEEGRLQSVRTTLSKFSNEAKLVTTRGSEHVTNYHVGLDPSMLNDAAVVTVNYSYHPPQIIPEENAIEHLNKQQQEFLLGSSSDVSACLPAPLTPTVASKQNQQLKMDKDSELTNTNFKENSTAKLPDNDETVRDNEAYFSDIDVDDAGYSQHPTGSTKTNSSLQQVNSAATIVDQKDPTGFITEAERLNLQMDQLQLSDAKAKAQLTTMAIQPKKNLNDESTIQKVVLMSVTPKHIRCLRLKKDAWLNFRKEAKKS